MCMFVFVCACLYILAHSCGCLVHTGPPGSVGPLLGCEGPLDPGSLGPGLSLIWYSWLPVEPAASVLQAL